MKTKQTQNPIRSILLGSIGFLGLGALLPAMGGNSLPSSDLTVTVQELANGDVQFSVSGTAYGKTNSSFSETEFDAMSKTPPHALGDTGSAYKALPVGLTLTVQPTVMSEPEAGGSVEETITEQVRDLEYVYFRGGGYWYLGTFDSASISAGTPIVGGGTVVSTDIPFSDFVPGTFMVSGDYFDMTYQVVPLVAPVPAPPQLSVQKPSRFATTKVGRRSRAKSVRISNLGGTTATGISVRTSGRASRDYLLTRPLATLAPGGSALFKVTFRPRSKGLRRATATVRAANADSSSVPLFGRGK